MDRRRFFKTAGLSALAVAAEMPPLPLKGSELFYASETSNRETNSNKTMKHKCKITVLKRECYQDLQGKYLADPKSGPCPFFREGQEIIVDNDNFFRMLHGSFCSEDEKIMITCCNDGTRPVIFKLERIDEEE